MASAAGPGPIWRFRHPFEKRRHHTHSRLIFLRWGGRNPFASCSVCSLSTPARLEALFLPCPGGGVHRQGQGQRPLRARREGPDPGRQLEYSVRFNSFKRTRSPRIRQASLDGQLKQSSKSPRADSGKVAWAQRRLRFPRYRRSESLKTTFGDTITGLWVPTLSLDPPELDNLYFGARAIWQRAYFYPISTSKVLHEMALIIVHRSPPPIRRGQAITLDLGKL
jgi:hypothetical protein